MHKKKEFKQVREWSDYVLGYTKQILTLNKGKLKALGGTPLKFLNSR